MSYDHTAEQVIHDASDYLDDSGTLVCCDWCKKFKAPARFTMIQGQCDYCSHRRAEDAEKHQRWRDSDEGVEFRTRIARERFEDRHDEYLRKFYGISLSTHQKLTNLQGGVCAREGCDRRADQFKRGLKHYSGKLYCPRCVRAERREQEGSREPLAA